MKLKMTNVLFCLLFWTYSFSQIKEIELTNEKQLMEYSLLINGDFYFQFGEYKPLMTVPFKKNYKIFTSELVEKPNIDLSDLSLNVYSIITPSSRLIGYEKQTNGLGGNRDNYFIQNNNKFRKVNSKDGEGPLKTVLKKIYSEKYQVFFGKIERIKDKSKMAGTEYNDLYFYRTDLKNFSTKLIRINLPLDSFKNSKMFYQYQSHTEDKIYFITNELVNNKTKNICNLISFDYDGKLIDKIPFEFETSQKREILYSNSSSPENYITKFDRYGNIVAYSTDGASVKTVINGDSFYSYGKFLNKEDDKIGFYIFKYDLKGNLIWKLEDIIFEKIDKKKSVFYQHDRNDLIFLKNNRIGFWEKTSITLDTDFFIIDAESGKKLETKRTEVLGSNDFEFNYSKTFNGLKSNLFIGGQNENIRLDMHTIFAINFFPEIGKFVNSKKGYKYETFINENGIYLLEENSKERNYKMYQFTY